MSTIMHDSTTTSDRKPSAWDSTGARAEADLTEPGVVEAIFDAGREDQRRTAALESAAEDIYAAGREYQRRVTAREAASAVSNILHLIPGSGETISGDETPKPRPVALRLLTVASWAKDHQVTS